MAFGNQRASDQKQGKSIMACRQPSKIMLPVAAVWAALALVGSMPQSANIASGISSAQAAEGGALFAPIATVLRDPRCMNCHPSGDRPRQGDDRHLHLQSVQRGGDGMGFVNMRCNACHRDENNSFSGVPGAPGWHLAPPSMGWEGLDDSALCASIKDTGKNGGRDITELVEHMRSDKLVLWGWDPGGKRTPVATPHAEFVKQLVTWADAGAPCP